MTLSPITKKAIHTAVVLTVSGGLTYLMGALSVGHFPGWKALGIGAATAAGSRLAGWMLAEIQTTP
jgi:hypothetical protein